MPQRVFRLLRHGVRCARERTERGDVGKVPVVVDADVERRGRPVGGDERGLDEVCRDMQARGEVVRASVRQIPERRTLLERHQPRDRLIERSVAPGADDQVELRAVVMDGLRRVAGALRLVDADEIAAAGKAGDCIVQRRTGPCLSRAVVDDKKQLFHGGVRSLKMS